MNAYYQVITFSYIVKASVGTEGRKHAYILLFNPFHSDGFNQKY